MHGAAWSCMELCGAVWSCVELYGAAWSCMEVPAGDPRGVRILAGAVCVYNYNEWRGGMGGSRSPSYMNTPSYFFSIF